MNSFVVINPFRFGALALDESFADRADERAELASDIRNGQDVVVVAPRRLRQVLPRLERGTGAGSSDGRAGRPGRSDDDADQGAARGRARRARSTNRSPRRSSGSERAALAPFRRLQVQPTVTIDPEDGSLLLQLRRRRRDRPISTRRWSACFTCRPSSAGQARRRTALVIDEFQEIVEIDPQLPQPDARRSSSSSPRSPTSTSAASATSWSRSSATPTSRSGAAPRRSSWGRSIPSPSRPSSSSRFHGTGK